MLEYLDSRSFKASLPSERELYDGLKYSIVTGYPHSLFLTSDGRVYACGANGNGQLGLGDNKHRSTFTLVPTATTASIISS